MPGCSGTEAVLSGISPLLAEDATQPFWYKMALFCRVFELGIFIYTFNFCYAFPRQRIANISRDDIKHKEMLPPDHIAGGHMEHDGDINKDFHHEAFLGTLVKEGKLDFSNMDGYRKLIGIFHKVDKNKDHLLDKVELQEWIHDRILEHYYAAKADSDSVFKKVDIDKDDLIRWYEYKATLVDLDPRKLRDANVSCKFFSYLMFFLIFYFIS